MPAKIPTADLRRICDLPMQLADEAEGLLRRLGNALDDSSAQLDMRGMDAERARVASAMDKANCLLSDLYELQDCIRSAAGVT